MRPLSWSLRVPTRRLRRRCVNCSSLSSGALSSPSRTSELASRDATTRWWTSALTSLKLTTSWRDGFSDVVRWEVLQLFEINKLELMRRDLLRTLNFPLLMNPHFRPESSMMTLWRKCRAGEGRDLSLRVMVVSSRTAHSSGENIPNNQQSGEGFAVNIIKTILEWRVIIPFYRYLLQVQPN